MFADIIFSLIDFQLSRLDIILDWEGDKRQEDEVYMDSKRYRVKGFNGEEGQASFYMEFSEQ